MLKQFFFFWGGGVKCHPLAKQHLLLSQIITPKIPFFRKFRVLQNSNPGQLGERCERYLSAQTEIVNNHVNSFFLTRG